MTISKISVNNFPNFFIFLVLRLSLGSSGPRDGVNVNGRNVHLLSVAPSEGRDEVGQLETNRGKILRGMQDGARRYRTGS